MRRTTGLVALVAVAVLAGCGGLGADAGRETLTPAPIPTDGPVGGESRDVRVAPGVTADELVNAEVLLRSHAAALRNTSYTSRRQVTRRLRDGPVLAAWESTARRHATAVRVRHHGVVRTDGTGAGTDLRVDRWSTDGRTYTAITRGNDTTYDVSRVRTGGETLDATGYSESLSRVLARLSPTVGEPVEANGTTAYPLRTTEPRDVPPLRNVTFEGYVTPEGVLTEYTLEYAVDDAGAPVEVTVHSTVSALGRTTARRPGWLPAAIAATNATAAAE